MPLCFSCLNYLDNYTCKAFPEGIPDNILFSKHNNNTPYPGDNGILFEPVKGREDLQKYKGKFYQHKLVGEIQ